MGIQWHEEWVQVLATLFLVIGFIIAILSYYAFFSYFAIVVSGVIAGRLYYIRRFRDPILPSVLIITGFVLGYLLGAIWASRFWTLVAFFLAFGISYQLHLKKIITIFKSEHYIK